MLQIKNLSVGYGKNIVIDSGNFEAVAGQFIAVIGENGVGKSTLLKTIAGLLPPVAGEVFLQNESVPKMGLEKRAKKVAVVLPHREFDATISVQEVLMLGRSPYSGHFGKLTATDAAVIESVVNRLNIRKFLEKRIFNLSDGERQKVLIARALIQDTVLLLLDEPTAFLDFRNRKQIFSILRKEADQGKLVICSTHDVHDVLQVATHILLVQNDKKLCLLPNRDLNDEAVFQMLHQ
ncbi:MAG: ABC transporter ATP-binding protein [Chitinophagales bacterium]